MSIRDELTALIARIGDTHVDADNTDFHRQIVDAILARYGIVELPEPDSVTESMYEYQGLAEWKTDLARIGEFDDGDGFIDTELSRLMNVSPGAMRELAAALLAAANRAEAQS
ncbi:hypothetical protein LRS71_09330 [Rhodococcus pyridinivorans]|uniref:hypothetical protein n=1 Tax=Rhodococcus pyridinivorans TaxID=103816 RepID=UPI001E57A352|nr:hypothetical protein [Rhodococcus pyridinivorans]MCD5419754.1 hypothetical protein [Rhodococcus pyridinivorans]